MTELPNGYIKVLDKGYVGLVDKMGTDNTPVRAARTSFKKSPDDYLEEQNFKLVKYLAKNKEYSCFRHQVVTFEIKMPLMIARQLWKYIVSSNFTSDQLGWNENSRRYITDDNEYYLPEPNEWRTIPENKKQGSAEPLSIKEGHPWTLELEAFYEKGEELYNQAMDSGIAPELARLFIPGYGLYVTSVWTTSLNALFHVLEERLDNHAQWEIREYAKAIKEITTEIFPVSMYAWEHTREA